MKYKEFFRSETEGDFISKYNDRTLMLLYKFLNRPYRDIEAKYFSQSSSGDTLLDDIEDIKASLEILESNNHIVKKSDRYSLNLNDETTEELYDSLISYLTNSMEV